LTGPEAPSAHPATRPTGGILPIPSDRASVVAHLVALTILVVETAYWLAQPCIGDVLCAPVVGMVTGVICIPLGIGIAIWRLAHRSSVLVFVDAVLITNFVPISLSLLAAGTEDPLLLLLLPGFSLVLLFGILGPIADLAGHRYERWAVVIAMVALAAWIATSGGTIPVFPLLVAFVLAFRLLERPDPAEAGGGPELVLDSIPHGEDREE
jgi:hypothetical protein